MILACGGAVAALAQAELTTRPAPAQPVATQPASAPAALDPKLDAILNRLERRTVRDLQAEVAWRQQYTIDLPEDATTKLGRIWYQDRKPVARFLIHFTGVIQAGRRDKLDERHMFDGEWYIELQSRSKTLTRTQVREPDDPIDVYKVGEGYFPLPFGQKKADILREFQVSLMPATAGDPADTDRVRLTPNPGTRTVETYARLDCWVLRSGPLEGLPIKVDAAKRDGTGKVNSYITITFESARLDTGIDDSLFDLKAPDDYQVIEEPLQHPAEP
jgi:hypothetical protein